MVDVLNILVLLYFVTLTAGYIALFVAAVVGVIHVRRDLEGSAPESISARGRATLPISILCPAFNEEKTVVESVRALLQLRYPQHEVVVVNDGSKDKTMHVLRQAFALEPVPFDIRFDLPCKPIRSVYRSGLYKKLVVIDKENGGKSDGLNCGVNAARYPLVCAIDADTLILPDALLRLVRPFLSDVDVVGVGGTICLANGCKIEKGELVEMGLPKSWLARYQVVEYLRAFLVGRLGWDRMGGNLIISGAFGLFRRSAVVAAGGYAHDSIGEDMELVTRLRHQVPSWLQGRAIQHLPDPVSFTEAPETLKILGNQRDRWQRGLADTLWRHRRMAFNPRYGSVGVVVMPFYVFFELFGPVVELFGYFWFFITAVAGVIDPWFAGIFLLLAVLIGFLLSLGSIFLEELTLSFYRNRGDLLRLIVVALVENIGYRQMVLWFRLRGLYKYLRGEKKWGRMTRMGFGGPAAQARQSRLLPILVTALIAGLVAMPVVWLVKPRPAALPVVLSKTVPFENSREHARMMWLLSQAKAKPMTSKVLWDNATDYVGYDPATRKYRQLAAADLSGKNLLLIADSYGVYRDDFDAFPRPVAHLELSQRIYGGMYPQEVEAIEQFVQRGGRIYGEFNTYATPTPYALRLRLEKLFNLQWSGWAGRRVDNFADDREIAQWVQKRWAEETGRPYDLVGPGILLIHEDGRVCCLQQDLDITADPLTLHAAGRKIPFTYWFDINLPTEPTEVRAEFTINSMPPGDELMRKFGISKRFPAIVHDDGCQHMYVAGDMADGQETLGLPWLWGVPTLRRGMASLGIMPEETRLLWQIYAPLLLKMIEADKRQ
ncbi:MAG: glycosyltransferase family 2 protein [Deltaproteobacteria bacterium]|nr:glycosyltransferase family 2 protein [Deltaproteobacteria bacterium]